MLNLFAFKTFKTLSNYLALEMHMCVCITLIKGICVSFEKLTKQHNKTDGFFEALFVYSTPDGAKLSNSYQG